MLYCNAFSLTVYPARLHCTHIAIFPQTHDTISLIGILVIFNPREYTLSIFLLPIRFQSYQVLPRILDFTTQNIAGCRLRVDTLIFSIWFTVAFILLLRLLVQYIRLHHALSAFFVEKEGAYAHLYEFLQRMPCQTDTDCPYPGANLSGHSTGLLHPILVMPDGQSFSETGA
ncbi:MAG: hypothetical protein ACLU80_08335 [Dorea sp.]